MADQKQQKRFVKWFNKLRNKYRLVILNDETLEEKLSFRLSRLNVFIAIGSLSIALVVITSYIIAFTPLKEYIPGFGSMVGQKEIYKLQIKADSLETAMKDKDLYILNIKNIISGKELVDQLPNKPDSTKIYKNITLKKSREDSLLRMEIESQEKYSVSRSNNKPSDNRQPQAAITSYLFFTPVKGIVTNNFDPSNKHYGIDVVAKPNEPIKAALDGTVIFSDWTLATGNTITVQHQQNLLTVYKHNSSILKKTGSFVKAGEPIAIIGNSGELSSGPHLHFELWFNGNPVNPKDYISF
jgi:murein DD-endopeptidase MepM/ murein hydrolase activator NlpD